MTSIINEHDALQGMIDACYKAYTDAVYKYAIVTCSFYGEPDSFIPYDEPRKQIIESYWKMYVDLCHIYRDLYWHFGYTLCPHCGTLVDSFHWLDCPKKKKHAFLV